MFTYTKKKKSVMATEKFAIITEMLSIFGLANMFAKYSNTCLLNGSKMKLVKKISSHY